MFLDLILPKFSDFRRYSTNIAILDVIPQKSDFRRYSTKIMILDVILQKYGNLDIIPVEYSVFRSYSTKIEWF